MNAFQRLVGLALTPCCLRELKFDWDSSGGGLDSPAAPGDGVGEGGFSMTFPSSIRPLV